MPYLSAVLTILCLQSAQEQLARLPAADIPNSASPLATPVSMNNNGHDSDINVY